MKKLLLATTAVAGLVAFGAADARAEIDLNLGGEFQGYVGFADQDTDNLREFQLKRHAEIHFNGETTLNNGLTVGANIEFQAEPDGDLGAAQGEADDVEESYLYFSGNWGRFNLGAEDGAAFLLQVATPGADAHIDGIDPTFTFVNVPAGFGAGVDGGALDYANDISEDDDKLTYITPKFNGFQAGVSYAPHGLGREAAASNLTGFEADNTVADRENLWELAARYDGDFNGVGVHFGAGYTHAGMEVDAATGLDGSDDYQEWNAGLKLAIDNFGIGVAYNTSNNAADNDNDSDIWVLGADYTYGSYKFGASYFKHEAEQGAGVSDDEVDRFTIGANYTFGPGMSFNGSAIFYDFDQAGTANDNDATAIVVGTAIDF